MDGQRGCSGDERHVFWAPGRTRAKKGRGRDATQDAGRGSSFWLLSTSRKSFRRESERERRKMGPSSTGLVNNMGRGSLCYQMTVASVLAAGRLWSTGRLFRALRFGRFSVSQAPTTAVQSA
ncbi:hypothetical protein VCV18_002620 [Metarhizium anisopliae]